jgi:homocitrate synthase NifV
VDAAKAYGCENIGVNAEDASRTDVERLICFGRAAKATARRGCYCDTLGYDNPFTIYETIKMLAERWRCP